MDGFMDNLKKKFTVEESPCLKRSALLVEDDRFCQKIQSHCLSELGYKVEIASNATTAIHRVEHSTYNLIVLDLGLPDESGELVICAIREFKANQLTPLIVATAQADAPTQQKCLYLGADIVFMKPFDTQTLSKAIDFCHSRIKEPFHANQ